MSQYLVAPAAGIGAAHSDLYAVESVVIREVVGRRTIRIEADPAAFGRLRALESVGRIEPEATDVQLLDPVPAPVATDEGDGTGAERLRTGPVTDGGQDDSGGGLTEVYHRATIQRCPDCEAIAIGDCGCEATGGESA